MMDLLLDMIAQALGRNEIQIVIGGKASDPAPWIEGKCYRILKKIQAIVGNDQLDDAQCFERIEAIMAALEEEGVDCGSRHDFGY